MSPLAVLSTGLACPLGLRRAPAVAALDAGISRMSHCELVRDAMGDEASWVALPRLDPRASRSERALLFTREALTECLEALIAPPDQPIPLFVAGPEPTGGPPLDLRALERVVHEVAASRPRPVPLSFRADRLLDRGRAGVFEALEAAAGVVAAGACEVALVGGLDSQVDLDSLRALSSANRLLGRGNPGGLIPAEGAAFVLVAAPRVGARLSPLGTIVGCAVGREPHPRGHAEPSTSLGLTAVFRALRPRIGARVDEIFSAETGELRHGRELSYAYLRNTALMPEPLRVADLGTTLGDAGAASGAIALVRAVASLHRTRRPPNGSALAYGSSDGGAVGACIVTRSPGRSR